MKLAGLAFGTVSGEVTLGIASPTVGVNVTVPPGMRKCASRTKLYLSLYVLQVNVTFPHSGTTYPPGILRASAQSAIGKG